MNEDRLFVLTDSSNVGNPPIKYVGYCEILPKYKFELTKMPNRFHRFMMTLLLGWKFFEYTEDKPSEKMLLNG
jgi:hypothetical protein